MQVDNIINYTTIILGYNTFKCNKLLIYNFYVYKRMIRYLNEIIVNTKYLFNYYY